MIGDVTQGGAGLGKWKVFYELSQAVWHILGRKKGIAQKRHRHNHVIGEAGNIRMFLGIK